MHMPVTPRFLKLRVRIPPVACCLSLVSFACCRRYSPLRRADHSLREFLPSVSLCMITCNTNSLQWLGTERLDYEIKKLNLNKTLITLDICDVTYINTGHLSVFHRLSVNAVQAEETGSDCLIMRYVFCQINLS
jgi:hypothetical protein